MVIQSNPRLLSRIGQFTTPLLLILLLSGFYPLFLGKRPVDLFSAVGLISFVITIVFPIYILVQMKINFKKVTIDNVSKTITFRMFILPVTQNFNFVDFDGYIEAIMPKDKYIGSYKCYYLVTGDHLKYKMSGRFYKNVEELKEGIAALPCLGSVNYTLSLGLRIALGQEVLSD